VRKGANHLEAKILPNKMTCLVENGMWDYLVIHIQAGACHARQGLKGKVKLVDVITSHEIVCHSPLAKGSQEYPNENSVCHALHGSKEKHTNLA